MRIDGTDPLAMNKIQEQTSKPEVQRTQDVFGDAQLKKREEIDRDKDNSQKGGRSGREKLEEAVKQANKATDAVNVSLRFSIHEDTDRVQVQMIDTNTDQVVREIPAEKVLDLVGKIQEMIGLMVDEKR